MVTSAPRSLSSKAVESPISPPPTMMTDLVIGRTVAFRSRSEQIVVGGNDPCDHEILHSQPDTLEQRDLTGVSSRQASRSGIGEITRQAIPRPDAIADREREVARLVVSGFD